MQLQDLLAHANTTTEETMTFSDGFRFINDVITKINIECNAKYPIYTAADSTAVSPLPDKWQLALFVPFLAARIKQVDSSQFEFEKYFAEFETNFKTFKNAYIIPDTYLDTDFATDNVAANLDGNPYLNGW